MRKILLLILCVYGVFGMNFQTLEDGSWSLDGETPTELIPGPNDNITILHDVTIDWLFVLNRGTITVVAPAVLTFLEEVIFETGAKITIEEGARVNFMRDLYNYSYFFENYGEVFYQEFIYNYGDIQSWGNFGNGNSGRKFHNFGQFNDLIGGTGPLGQQAYKDDELDSSTPTDGDELPVVWGAINGKYLNVNQLYVSWEVFSEKNNNFFYVVASVDANEWDTIAFVSGRGTDPTAKSYFVEVAVDQKYEYVGVGQYDFDGAHHFGGIAKVTPIHDIQLEIENGIYNINSLNTLHVYNELGQQVNVETYLSGGKQYFDLQNLAKGVYIISLEDAEGFKSFKVMQ